MLVHIGSSEMISDLTETDQLPTTGWRRRCDLCSGLDDDIVVALVEFDLVGMGASPHDDVGRQSGRAGRV